MKTEIIKNVFTTLTLISMFGVSMCGVYEYGKSLDDKRIIKSQDFLKQNQDKIVKDLQIKKNYNDIVKELTNYNELLKDYKETLAFRYSEQNLYNNLTSSIAKPHNNDLKQIDNASEIKNFLVDLYISKYKFINKNIPEKEMKDIIKLSIEKNIVNVDFDTFEKKVINDIYSISVLKVMNPSLDVSQIDLEKEKLENNDKNLLNSFSMFDTVYVFKNTISQTSADYFNTLENKILEKEHNEFTEYNLKVLKNFKLIYDEMKMLDLKNSSSYSPSMDGSSSSSYVNLSSSFTTSFTSSMAASSMSMGA